MNLLPAKRPIEGDVSADRLIRIFQSETGEIRERRPPIQARVAVLSLSALLFSLVALSNVLMLDRVVTSQQGQIVTVDPNVVLQPLDLSIIKSIDVQEGDYVKRGQSIVELDPTIAAADVDALQMQLDTLDAQIARCEAELAQRPYEYASPKRKGEVDYGAVQRALFEQRKAQFISQVHAYDEQIALARATIVKFTDDARKTEDRTALATRIEQMWVGLEAKDSGSTLQTLTAKDTTLQLTKTLEFDRDSIAETEHQIQATTATRQAFVQQWMAQASQEMVTARTQRDAANEQLEKALKHQQLLSLDAPDDAIVLRLEKRSVGSILQPGEAFAELALLSSPVEAEILIDPRDIGFVRPGDHAVIKLDPFHFVEHGAAEGYLRWVSQGTFTSSPTGTGGTTNAVGTSSTGVSTNAQGSGGPYYKARLAITKTDLKNVPADFRLLPGSTLSADIHVGTRSVFWYLVRGVVRGYDEAMREP